MDRRHGSPKKCLLSRDQIGSRTGEVEERRINSTWRFENRILRWYRNGELALMLVRRGIPRKRVHPELRRRAWLGLEGPAARDQAIFRPPRKSLKPIVELFVWKVATMVSGDVIKAGGRGLRTA